MNNHPSYVFNLFSPLASLLPKVKNDIATVSASVIDYINCVLVHHSK